MKMAVFFDAVWAGLGENASLMRMRSVDLRLVIREGKIKRVHYGAPPRAVILIFSATKCISTC